MLLSCGDALFDLFTLGDNPKDSGPTAITISGNVGGSPLNVAIGIARLGHTSRFFTKLSGDVFGERMREYLALNNLNSELCIDTDLNTTLAIVNTNDDGSANYSFYLNSTADVSIERSELPAQLPDEVKILHFGSYSTVLDPTASTLLALAQREKGKRFISYDPNLRPSVEPDIDKWRDAFRGFAATASLIKASDEDIKVLFGTDAEDKFVADCFDLGAQLVCITRGPDGSSGYTPNGGQVFAAAPKTNVIDTVGAGDTFQAAMLHHLVVNDHISNSGNIQGDVSMQQAIEFAALAASITCSRMGADLPTLADFKT